jgi:ArsR family transcriptional regulator, arsenate/arsenite/antimonite-responsive transcriptional repressor
MAPGYTDARQLAGTLKAMADETRLQMLVLLAKHAELCVCDLEHTLDITQSKASRHLRYLLNARLVDDRRDGLWVYYRLADGLEPSLRDILASIHAALNPSSSSVLGERLDHWLAVKTCEPRGSRVCG